MTLYNKKGDITFASVYAPKLEHQNIKKILTELKGKIYIKTIIVWRLY